jgi:hypothetical protein
VLGGDEIDEIVNVAFTQTGGDYGSTEEATNGTEGKIDSAP